MVFPKAWLVLRLLLNSGIEGPDDEMLCKLNSALGGVVLLRFLWLDSGQKR